MTKLARNRRALYEPLINSVGTVGLSQWLAVALAVVVIGVLIGGIGSNLTSGLEAFEFSYNPYAFLSLIVVASNLWLLFFVGWVKSRSASLVWLSAYVVCLLLWSAVDFLVRISATPETALFWQPMAAVPYFFSPAVLFMFVLSYTKPNQARHGWTMAALFVTGSLLIFFDLRTTLIHDYTQLGVASGSWNVVTQPGVLFNVALLWSVGLVLLAMGLLLRFHSRTVEAGSRLQARFFMAAVFVAGVASVVGGGVWPFAILCTAVAAAVLVYGVWHYQSLTFNPLFVATNILETINEAVIGVSPDLNVMYVNKEAKRLLGYTQAQFGALKFPHFLSQEWDARVLKKALFGPHGSDENNLFDAIDLRRADGSTVTTKLSVSPIVEDGVAQGHLVVVTDISRMAHETELIERTVLARTREVQEAQATLVASINSIKLGFIITDSNPEVIRVNTVAHNLFCPSFRNHAAGDCTQVTIEMVQSLVHGDFSIASDIATCLKRQLPHEVKDVSLNDHHWRLYLSPMAVDHESIGCVVLFQDTTEERLLERSRDEFFSIASHELRTPLTSIKGNSALILQYYQEILKDQALNEMVVDIHDSSDRLIEIVNDFLDVSRLEQGRIEFHLEQLSIAKVIEEVVYGMGALLKQKGLHIKLSHNISRLDALPMVVVDKNRLKQILFNLLGNAVKFTSKGFIKIEAELLQDAIEVSITDSGIGISLESQALLFHKFQQAGDSILTRDSSHGTGLGLYISRLLAAGMGGKLGLQKSVLGKGSTFFVRVPLSTPARLRHLNDVKVAAEAEEALADKK